MWQQSAACRNMDKDDFYPDSENNAYIEEFLPCRSVCLVKHKCLEFSIIYDEDGIWGGETRKTRNSLSKQYVLYHNKFMAYRNALTLEAIKAGYLEGHPDPEVQEFLLARLYEAKGLGLVKPKLRPEQPPVHIDHSAAPKVDPLANLDQFLSELDECIQLNSILRQ